MKNKRWVGIVVSVTILVSLLLLAGCDEFFPDGSDGSDGDPDLIVSECTPLTGVSGELTGVRLVLENIGDADASNVDYVIVLSPDMVVSITNDTTIYEDQVSLDAGRQKQIDIDGDSDIDPYMVSHSVTITTGTYFLGAFIDPDDNVAEEDETNNENTSTSSFTFGSGGTGNQPPVANAGGNQIVQLSTDGRVTVNFNGGASSDSDGTITQFMWNFGDGTFGFGAIVSKTYINTGIYTVTLTVVDDGGATSTDTIDVTVQSNTGQTPPTAQIIADSTSISVGGTVNFDAGGSSDDGSITLYKWDFDGNGTVDAQGADLSTVSHTYQTAGNYTAKVIVTDNDGLNDDAFVEISVSDTSGNASPIAKIYAYPTSITQGESVYFDGYESEDTDGTIASYSWDIDNDGDEDYSGVWFDHTFNTAGNIPVVLTVTDDGGLTDTETVTISVASSTGNMPPVAYIYADTTEINKGESVSFDAYSSYDDDGEITAYSWDVGDDGSIEGTGAAFTHTFTTAGEFEVWLTITDDGGLTAYDYIYIFVNDVSSNQPPTASFTYMPEAPIAGEQVSFIDTSTDPDGDSTIFFWSWDFGDGFTSTQQDPTHTYQTGGDYQVTLTVTDDNSATDTYMETITVDSGITNSNPIADAGPDQTVQLVEGSVEVTFDGSGSYDPDNDALTLGWDIDGDGEDDIYDVRPTYTFTTADTYTVTLTVSDTKGGTDTDTVTITVNEEVVTDTTPPATGNNGLISIDTVYATSIEVSWTKASDDTSSQSKLYYTVYWSTDSMGTTPTDIINNGVPATKDFDFDWGELTGLQQGTPYYINIIVEDEAGNMEAYQEASTTTSTESGSTQIIAY